MYDGIWPPPGEGAFDFPVSWDVDMMAGAWAAIIRSLGEAANWWRIKVDGGWIPDNQGSPHTNRHCFTSYFLFLNIILLILSYTKLIQITSIWSGKIIAREQVIL